VLKDFTLRVPAGASIGIIGSSGVGKSTLVQLLFRFYDPCQGQICIDGQDLKDYDLNSLRRQMAVVFQEPVLFTGSIRENISFGCSELAESEVEEAARQAQALKFINKHLDGFERNVGIRGSNLSAGQKQRIAIARTLVRKPKILIFDEATSALDAKTETKLQGALRAAQFGRTCIVIAHRLSTLQDVDSIVVMEDGQIKDVTETKKLIE
jgi:ABC-type multidrug transport system fused ATPase/permease subunit